MDPAAIGLQFVTQYYQMFDTNRAALAQLYVRAHEAQTVVV